MLDINAPGVERLLPSASYHSMRLDELACEDDVLRVAGAMLWALAQDDPFVEKIVADIGVARMIRAGVKLALEGEMLI